MRSILVLVSALGISMACIGADAPENPKIRMNGFSILPLKVNPAAGSYQALVMMMPASQGFAPNVNVQIQQWDDTMGDYVALSRNQTQALGFKVLSEKVGTETYTVEYSGPFQNRELHWFARAELRDGKVFLATATATEQQWEESGEALRECVNSLRPEE